MHPLNFPRRARRTLGALAVALAWLPALAAAETWVPAGVDHFYLHQPAGSFTGLYRSQGVATDGSQWFFSWQFGLERTDLGFNSLQRNSSFSLPMNLVPGIPLPLLAQGLDHIGDFDVHNGTLYVPLDSAAGHYQTGHVALFKASDLSYTGQVYALSGAPSNPHGDVASWVAVDGAAGLGYGKEWRSGNTINVYHLADWQFSHTLTLDQSLSRIQGAKVYDGWLYLSSDYDTQSVYRANLATGHVEELFQLPAPDGEREVEGIALRTLPGGGVEMVVELIVDPDRSGQDLANANLRVDLYHYTLSPVPEPASAALWLGGLALLGGLGGRGRRRRRA